MDTTDPKVLFKALDDITLGNPGECRKLILPTFLNQTP